MTLAQKGLILLSLPLLLQFGLVAYLSHLHSEAESEALLALRAQEVSDLSNRFVSEAYRTVRLIIDAFENNESLDVVHAESTENLMQTAAQLKVLLKDDPAQLSEVEEAESAADKMVKLAGHALTDKSGEYPTGSEGRRHLYKQLRGYGHVLEKLLLLQRRNKQIVSDSPERQALVRDRAKSVLLIFSGVNVVFILLMGAFFSRYVFRRLDVMIDNSRRLAARQELGPRMKGSDEIARIDTAFHEMADALTRAMREQQEIVQMVSHDLSTPLSTIKAFLDMVVIGRLGELNEKGRQLHTVAERAAKRMRTLIDDLLEVEKAESGVLQLQKSQVSLSSLFEQAVQAVQPAAGERGVQIRCQPTELTVHADSDRLMQVVVNLLGNAVKFSPADGTVSISAEPLDGFVEVRIADQGRGIPAHLTSTIFNRFEQVHASDATEKGGSGLGLAICKALVELHGGEIRVESEEGKGSTFAFRIPADSNHAPLVSDRPAQ